MPGDKSISHRAVMLAGRWPRTRRHSLAPARYAGTLEVIRALGVPVEVAQRNPDSWELRIEGRGLHGLRKPNVLLDCRKRGTGIRLLTGIMSGQSFSSILDGSAKSQTANGPGDRAASADGGDIKIGGWPRPLGHMTGRCAASNTQ